MKRAAQRTTSAIAPVVLATCALGAACITRPVAPASPNTSATIGVQLRTRAVDKIDLLFAIDNSASMGDKQEYLKRAIPDLVTRLVTPNCVDEDGISVVGISHGDGVCDRGKVEFPPVHDLHIGIVSTSLGSRLGDQCTANGVVDGEIMHDDDKSHLLTRSGADEHANADAQGSGFLAWFPPSTANQGKSPGAGVTPIVDPAKLQADFQELVVGVNQHGCGIESQLESWYRFLIQPDPYDHLELAGGKARWAGVDAAILQQRKAFLRPDSLVAVVVLSDENDSEIDVRSYAGQGYKFMDSQFQPPRAVSACDATPADPACVSCAQPGASGDPACAKGPYAARNDWGYDLNLRHVHMKQKYGLEPQFPISRYVDGLTAVMVPDRNGEYPENADAYVGNAECRNPLFAAELPDGSDTSPKALCDLKPGPRDKSLVFYAHIGGVPHELLHFTPNDREKSALSDADWVKILGKDPQRYDYAGIDPHMIESYAPRPGLPPPGAANDADPIHGREWITDQGNHLDLAVDRQYACTFPLASPRDCQDPANKSACDCSSTGLSHEQTPPVCDPATPTLQVRAKAYPTIRELLLAKLVGAQGIVSSICPIHVTEEAPQDPLYGYRPAVTAIVDRLKDALTIQCLPEKLTRDPGGEVPCLVLVALPTQGDASACKASLGLAVPDPSVLPRFREQQRADWLAAGGAASGAPDPATFPVCQLAQLAGADLVGGSCSDAAKPGWCYADGPAAQRCAQAILFSPGSPPDGSKISLQCIESYAGAGN